MPLVLSKGKVQLHHEQTGSLMTILINIPNVLDELNKNITLDF